MKARALFLIVLIPAITTLSACGSWWLPRPHKITIQQGNVLPTDTVEQVKIGMSKNEVTSLLGAPLTTNQINPNRWEYIFSINRSGETPNVRRLSLEFQNDQVVNLEKDGIDQEG